MKEIEELYPRLHHINQQTEDNPKLLEELQQGVATLEWVVEEIEKRI